jgi:DNA-binding NtrC family response regulator
MPTAFGSIDNAITAIKFGAIEYLTKPVDMSRLRAILAGALDLPERSLTDPSKSTTDSMFGGARAILGGSSAVAELKALIDRVAVTEATVLIPIPFKEA